MKLPFPILIFFFCLFSTTPIFAQSTAKKFSVYSNNKNLTTILNELSQQTGKNISFGNALTDPIMINDSFINQSIEELIYNLTTNTKITATFAVDSSIIIIPRQSLYKNNLTIFVTDKSTGEPLPSASILLDDLKTGSMTDSTGSTTFENLPSGIYKFSVRYLGYQEKQFLTCIKHDQPNFVHLQLEQMNIEVPEIEVIYPVSSVRELGLISEHLTIREIMDKYNFSGNIFKSAETIPGLIYDEFSSGFSIRGGSPFETGIMLDNLMLYSAYHFDDFLRINSIVNGDIISNIEINRGGFNASYGNSLSGILKLTTQRPESTGWKFHPSNNSVSGTGFGKTTNASWLISARMGDESTNYRDTYDSGNLKPVYSDICGKWNWQPNNQYSVSLHYLFSNDRVDVQRLDNLWTPNLDSKKYANNIWVNSQFIASSGIIYKQLFSFQDIFKQTDFNFSNSIDEVNTDKRNYNIPGINLSAILPTKTIGEFELGTEIQYYNLFYRFYEKRNEKGSQIDSSNVRFRQDHTLFAFYFNHQIKPTDDLTVQSGVRIYKMSYSGFILADPRLTIGNSLTENINLTFSAGIFTQYTHPDKLDIALAKTQNPTPDRLFNLSFDFQHSIPFNLRYSFSLYRKNYFQLSDDPQYAFNERYAIFNPLPESNIFSSGKSEGYDLFIRQDQSIFSWLVSYSVNKSTLSSEQKTIRRSSEVGYRFDLGIGINLTRLWNFSLLFRNQSGSPFTEQINPVLFPVIYPKTLLVDYGERNAFLSDPVESLKIKLVRDFSFPMLTGNFYFGINNVLDYSPTYQKHRIPKNQSLIIVPVNKRNFTPRTIFIGLQFSSI